MKLISLFKGLIILQVLTLVLTVIFTPEDPIYYEQAIGMLDYFLMIYFLHSLTMLYVSLDIYVVLELIFATSMFIGCTYYSKHRGQELGLRIRKLKEELAEEKAAHEHDKPE